MPSSRTAAFSCAILSVFIVSTFCFAAAPDRVTGPIVAAQSVRLASGVPLNARPEFDQGPVDPSFRLGHITLLTVPSTAQQRALNKLLADQQNPHSPKYHQWLTPEQYADRFGLSQKDVQKVTTWLESEGFAIVQTARGRNFIVFSGNAGQVERAFQIPIHNYTVEGESHFANTTPPAIPVALSGIVTGFRGLNNFRPKSQAHISSPDYTFPVTGGFLHFIAPGDIATIYDINSLYTAGIDGTGQKLAIIGQTDVYQADLADFRSGFGLSAINCTTNPNDIITACNTPNFHYVLVNSDPGSPSNRDLLEADIDLQWSGAVARNAQIIYVNAPDPFGAGVFDSLYYTIDNDLAPVMSMSYTTPCELAEAQAGAFASDEAEFQKANAEGITFLNSSGDSGAAECDFQANLAVKGYAVGYPASSPEVTGVGGTLIPSNEYTSTFWSTTNGTDGGSALSYIPEQAWNDAQEWGAFCSANPSLGFCTRHKITNFSSAQTVVGIVAGGGGLSNCIAIDGKGACTGGFPQPTYQQALSIPGQTTAVRFSPDVSLLASIYWPGYIVCTAADELPGFTGTVSTCAPGGAAGITNNLTTYGFSFGGTSISSPVFAGIVTLMNQYLVQNGFQSTPGLGNANPALYQMAAFSPSGFHQLTAGSNGAYCTPGTPKTQPVALQCPTAGFLGFDASNFDSTTGYNLVNGLGSVDANNLATAWGNLLTPLTTFTIATSTPQIYEAQSAAFTVNITPTTANGVATYDNGATALGNGTVSFGAGQFATTTLPVGTAAVTAAYVGNFKSGTTSNIATVTVLKPDFTIAGASSATVLSGQSATYTLTVTPTTTPTFTSTVTLSCSGVPDATVTCTMTPPTIAANQPATQVTATVTTSGPNQGTVQGQAIHGRRADHRLPWLPLAFPLAGVVMVGFVGRKLSRYSIVASLCLALTLLGALVACGGSSAAPISVSGVSGTPSSLFPNNTADGWPSQTAKFSATVSNDPGNKGVTWTVTGSPANGTIDANGLYTAPNITAGLPARVTITATSIADSSKSGSTTETLTPTTVPGPYTLTVTATEASTPHSQSVALTVQ